LETGRAPLDATKSVPVSLGVNEPVDMGKTLHTFIISHEKVITFLLSGKDVLLIVIVLVPLATLVPDRIIFLVDLLKVKVVVAWLNAVIS